MWVHKPRLTFFIYSLCTETNDPVWCRFVFTGKFKDVYHDYKYTYQGCGIILIVASVFLFAGMGLNYRLLYKEKKKEERRGVVGVGEQKSNRDNAAKEVAEARNTEDTV